MSVNKLERLLNLTAVLLDSPRPLAADELRQKVEGYPPPGPAFHRTFERDKEDLRVLGIPLRIERVPASDPPIDGYRIAPEDYYLPDPGLDPEELAALHLASLAVRLDGLGDQEALWKLGGLGADGPGPEAFDEPGVVSDVVASLPADPALVPLFQAISERQVVRFGYRGETRSLEPWRLDFQRGRWYVTGYDRVREGERNFRLDRIEGGVERTEEAAEQPSPRQQSTGPPRSWEVGDDEQVVAKLLVDAERVAVAERYLGSGIATETRPDGSVVYTVPVVNHDAFRSFVLIFLEYAEILEPLAWRDDIVAWLEALTVAADPATGARP